MNSWSENIKLTAPLREATLAEGQPGGGSSSPGAPDAWRAGYQAGLIEGERALSEQLLKQRAELHELMQGTLTSLRQAVPQVVRDAENTLVSLALEVAQKLVSDMPISVPMLEAAVRDALAQVEGTTQFTVRLHPTDLELLQKAGSPLLERGQMVPAKSAFWAHRRSRGAVVLFKRVSGRWMPGAKPNLICSRGT